jgi:hypothetical protein
MKIKMLRQCVVNKESQKIGAIVDDVSDSDGAYLIGTGAAVKFAEKAAKPAKAEKSEKPEQEKS